MSGFFDSPKRAFLEALLLALVVFIIGVFLGISFEDSRLNEINEYYALSEISLMDSIAFGRLSEINAISCDDLARNNIEFADKIYAEAALLEKYEGAGELTDSLLLAHRKYDVLRTILWINVIEARGNCKNNISSVVYLYNYDTDDLSEKATQIVWSRILFDLKQEKQDEIILIPIAVNSGISSLDSLTKKFGVSRYPAVVINEKDVPYELASAEDIEKLLN